MIRFALLTLLLAGLIALVVYWGVASGWFELPSFTREIILFLAVTHLGMYRFVVRQLDRQPEDFVKIYLGATVLRIFFFGVFIFLVIWLEPDAGTGNALLFLVSYFLFTALEVAALYRAVNTNKPTKTGQKGH